MRERKVPPEIFGERIKKAIIVLSGGMDSATLLYFMLDLKVECIALSIDYGQRHVIELSHAARLAEVAGVRHFIADLRALTPLLGGSALTSAEIAVPHGHYQDESMKLTVVPNRNMLLIAVAGAAAVNQKAQAVCYGAHAGDHAIYPDCRPEFADAMSRALYYCDFKPVQLVRPFIDMKKSEIAQLGASLKVPFELTWSCYEGVPPYHCGRCGTCVERREAFRDAGLIDPTKYGQVT